MSDVLDSSNKLVRKLDKLTDVILHKNIYEIAIGDEETSYMIDESQRWGHFWGGADVMIHDRFLPKHKEWLGNQPVVLSLQSTEPMRRVVITKHAAELTWLFIQLRELYRGRIDYISKYDFYGELAQTAIYIIHTTDEQYELSYLLYEVIRTSKKYI